MALRSIKASRSSKKNSKRQGACPRIEGLERRLLLAVDTLMTSGNWAVGTNWSTGSAPASTDDAVIPASLSVTINTSVSAAGVTTASGSSMELASGGNLSLGSDTTSIAGTFTLDGGTLTLGAGTNSISGATTWSSGTINTNSGTLTNASAGVMTLSNTSGTPVTLEGGGSLLNYGTMELTSAGGLQLENGSTLLNNEAGATFSFQADASVTAVSGSSPFDNEGTIQKTAGTGTSAFENNGGSLVFSNSAKITVQKGTIQIATPSGTSTGGTFAVSSGAILDLTGGQTVNYQGTYTGSGAGTVEVADGTLAITSSDATFNFPAGLFQWTGGAISIPGSSTLTNVSAGVLTLSNTSVDTLEGGGSLLNYGTMELTSAGGLQLENGSTLLNNEAGATFSFQADASVTAVSGSSPFDNEGTIQKTAGTGTSAFENNGGSLAFNNSANITVQTGEIEIATPSGTSTGGTFAVSSSAILDLTGGTTVNYEGTYTATGAGHVVVSGGTLQLDAATTFDFPTGVFQWSGGYIDTNSQTLTNTGDIVLDNASADVLEGGSSLLNQGTMEMTISGGTLELDNTSTVLDNQATGTFSFEADASVAAVSGTSPFDNEGTIQKTAGTGTSAFENDGGNLAFNNNSAKIKVQTGTIELATPSGLSTGGTFTVASGATLDLTGGQTVSYEGTYTETGAGRIILSAGTLQLDAATTFDFPAGVFQWSGGYIDTNSQTLTNTGDIVLDDASADVLYGGGSLLNQGTMELTSAGTLELENGGTVLDNQAAATFSFEADATVGAVSGTSTFDNEGTIQKTVTTGTSVFENDGGNLAFNNNGANINVQTGTIEIATPSGTSTGGAFTVASGATLDLTGGTTVNYEGNYTETGAGHVIVSAGTLQLDAATTFDFPAGVFQWSGGNIDTNSQTLTNTGDIVLDDASADVLYGGGSLLNQGTMELTSAGTLELENGGTVLDNQAAGTFSLEADATVGAVTGTSTFDNEGTVQKTAGTGTSNFENDGGGIVVSNTGTFAADSGTVALPDGATQLSGGAVTAGTWIANNATLSASSTTVTTIDSGAQVTLIGSSASIPWIAPLTTNNGTFGVLAAATFTTAGPLANTGKLSIGGALTVSGNFTQTSASPEPVLDYQVSTAPGGSGAPLLTVTGSTALGGNLQAELVDGFAGTANASYTVASFASSATGSFASTAGVAPDFRATINPTDIILNVGTPPVITSASSQSAPVGLPDTFTVTASGYPASTFSETGTLPGGMSFSTSTGVLSGTPASGSPAVYDITFGASNGVTPAASQPFTLTITKVASTAKLTKNTTAPIVYGQSVTLTATIASASANAFAPSGTVDFKDGTSLLGTGTISAGVATFTTTTIPAGSNSITAVYVGDSNFTTSTSSALSQTVNKASTSTALASSVSAGSKFGQSVTFTATPTAVAPGAGTPTGTVTFKDGSATLGTATLSSGVATFTTASLSVGSHSITAAYGGDGNFNASTSSAFSQTVAQSATTTGLTSSASSGSKFGQSVTFTATPTAVAPGAGTPTGTVSFKDGSTTLGTATLSSGVATFTTASLSVGSHSITAVYGGDTNFITSTSSTLSQTVNQSATTTKLTKNTTAPIVFGQTVSFTATLAAVSPGAGTPTGTVTFKDGGTTLGTGTLSGGVATLTTSALPLGSNSITAVYGGDTNFTTSTSSALSQTVDQAATTTALTRSTSSITYGQSVTFTAMPTAVSPGSGTPTGTVTFKDGTTVLGTATLSGGVTTFTTTTLPAGSDSITAVYGGDADFTTSTSSALTETVSQSATTTTLTKSSTGPLRFGQGVTFTATMAAVAPGAGTPTGTVTFKDGTTSIGTGTLASGVATFATTALPVGSNSITAVYGGDPNFTTSTSGAITQTVDQSSTTTTLTKSTTGVVKFGQSITFTATVAAVSPGAGTATGTVTFMDNGSSIGTATLSGGVATLTTTTLPAGSNSIKAVYGGDTNFSTSTSGSLTQTVNQTATTTTLTKSTTGPVKYGQSITFTATIAAVSPGAGLPANGETVTFMDGTTELGTAALSSGVATFTTTTLPVGSNSITAVYGGDANYTSSTSGALTQTVNQADTTTNLTKSTSGPITSGTSVTFTATVAAVSPGSGAPTAPETINFMDNGSSIGTATLDDGVATLTTTTLPLGSNSITAIYSGDTDFEASTSNTLTQTVNA